jgi:hypothetical protein
MFDALATQQEQSQKQNQIEGQSNTAAVAAVVMQIYSALTSGADLRSWLTLPNNIQIGQYALAPQTYTLKLTNVNKSTNLNVPIVNGQTTLVWVTQYGNQLKARVFTLNSAGQQASSGLQSAS